jgi:carbonic anhydrase
MPAHAISTHAVLRYVERVMGVDLDRVRAAMKTTDPAAAVADGAILAHLEKERKIVVEKVRELMMTPLVMAAIRGGATRVRSDGWWFIIEDKTVVTVVPKSSTRRSGHRSKPKYQYGRRPDPYERF